MDDRDTSLSVSATQGGGDTSMPAGPGRTAVAGDLPANPFQPMLDVGAALVSSLSLEETIANVAAGIGLAMDCWEVDIHSYDAGRSALILEGYWRADGVTPEDLAYIGTVIDLSQRPSWRAVVEQAQVSESHADDPDLPPEEGESFARWGYKTTLQTPMLIGDDVLGTLSVSESRYDRRFNPIERDLFAQLAQLAAIAIHHARLYRRQKHRLLQQLALADAGRALISGLPAGHVVTSIECSAVAALEATRCSIVYASDPASQRHPRPGSEGTATVIEHVTDRDLQAARRHDMERHGECTRLLLPLHYRGRGLGSMTVAWTDRQPRLLDDDLAVASGLASLAALALARDADARHRPASRAGDRS